MLHKDHYMCHNPRIVAVVITYNRQELLMATLSALLAQTVKLDCIYVIDNASEDGTQNAVTDLANRVPAIRYHRLTENSGGSGGFYSGIRLAYEDGAELIWGMDDDACPESDALAVLLKERTKFPENTVMWSNIVMRDTSGNQIVHWRTFSAAVQEERGFTFVGFLLPRSVIGEIGFPRADLFILYDEVEYSDRIRRAGYRIMRCRESKINHPYINSLESRRWCGITFRTLKMSNWKWYYFIRNGILIYSWRDPRKYRLLLLSLWIAIKSLLVDRENLTMILSGLFDGLRGKAGKLQVLMKGK